MDDASDNDKDRPVFIISDAPETEKVDFGFDADAKTLAEMIANKDNRTPMVIGVYGYWGSGKTTLMEAVRRKLAEAGKKTDGRYRTCKTVWFQAWKHRDEDQILAALIETILVTMKQEGFLKSCKAEIEQLIARFKPSKLLDSFKGILGGIDVGEFFADLEHKEKLGFFIAFDSFFERLIWTYLNWRPQTCAIEQTDDSQGVLVIFIDDLDRCPEDRVLRVLETVKLFLDKPGCVFVIGAAQQVIERALEVRYGDEAGKFMDKIVQATYHLPQIPTEDFEKFVKRVSPKLGSLARPYLQLVVPAMNNNPRRLKRFLNNLALREGMLNNRGMSLSYEHLLHWSIIEYAFPLLRNEILENPRVLTTLRKNVLSIRTKLKDTGRWEIPDEMMDQVPQSLRIYVQDRRLSEIVGVFDADIDQVRQLLTLSQSIKSIEKIPAEERALEASGMVDVPAGEFAFGDDRLKKSIESSYAVDIYPVTNSQYYRFVKAGGYDEDLHWSKDGWAWRRDENVTQPQYWENARWNPPDRPVVGVSWYEADAYARWAGKRLPSELEWERAARGDEGQQYPWGDDFDKERCNTKESGIGRTTRVTRYPNGISPVGCYDMAGNIWEWTDSWYDKDKDSKVVRGGSWLSPAGYARCTVRHYYYPDLRGDYIGFRCART